MNNIFKQIGDRTLIDRNRLGVIKKCLDLTKNLPGSNAEIGAYKGGSSYFIAAHSPKQLFVCDSFEGLPETTEHDRENQYYHSKGDFSDTSLESVSKFLSIYPQVKVIKGFFPNQNIHTEMYEKEYSFVHLDVDLFQPTLDCLEFFYPKMKKGGIILTDDYTWIATPGVERAYTKFFYGKEKVINSGFNSAYIIKE